MNQLKICLIICWIAIEIVFYFNYSFEIVLLINIY
jgi:hypothetical protein